MAHQVFDLPRLSICLGVLLAAALAASGPPIWGQDGATLPTDFQQQLQYQSEQIEQLQQQLNRQQELIQDLSEPAVLPPPEDPTDMADEADWESEYERPEEAAMDLLTQPEVFQDNPSDSLRVVNGRLHIDGWAFPNSTPGINVIETGDPAGTPQDRLVYRRMRFGVGGQLSPKNVSYRMEIEFSGSESQFRDAWIGWDDLLIFQTLRVGNLKRPYGLDHLHSSNYMVFLERPFIDDAVNADNRRFGALMYGVSDDETFNWRLGVFDQRLVQDMGEIVDDNSQPELAWRVANTWWYDYCSDGRNYGHLGLSGTFAFPDGLAPNVGHEKNAAIFQTRPEARSSKMWLDTGRITGASAFQLLGIESVLNVGALQVGGEFMNVWLQRYRRFGHDVYFSGGYVYLSYFLTGEHLAWNRSMGVLRRVRPFQDFFHRHHCDPEPTRGPGAWQVAVRFSYADFNDEDILGGRGESVTAALNWYWNSHSRLQVNYIVGRVNDRLAGLTGGGSTIAAGDYQTFGVRAMVDF